MNYFESLSQTARENQQRSPGSGGATNVVAALKALTAELNLDSRTDKLPVFYFKHSLWIWAAAGMVFSLAGYAFPQASLVGSLLLLFLLGRELASPLLGKLAPGEARNFIVNLAAKNKETQKVFLIANYDTQSLINTPGSLKPANYLQLLYGIAAVMTLTSIGFITTHIILFNHLNLLLLWGVAVINRIAQNRENPSNLKSCAALLEAATLLEKVKPSITSVTFCFCGGRSLNSDVLALLPEFAQGPKELTYVVSLNDTTDSAVTAVQLITAEGSLPTKNADATLVSVLKEVAREKSLRLEPAKTTDFLPTYPLNRSKVNPVSLLIPQSDSIPVRDLRELLCGLIRKLEH